MTKPRILFVDDEPKVLDGLRRMLHRQRREWQLDFATGGENALQLMAESPCDIVVTDMRMPGMDGADFLAQVAERYPETVRFILSGHSEEKAILRSLPFTHQYLSKPCESTELKEQLSCALALKRQMRNDELRRIIAQVDSLPSLPHLYQELREKMAAENVGLKDIAAIVNQDIGMSAKVLQLVNSSFFGLSREITGVQQAVSLLGIETLKSLVLSVEVFRELDMSTEELGFSMQDLSDHSLECGALAKQIVMSETQDRKQADYALTAGVLHDVGKLILATKLPDQFRESVLRAQQDQLPLYEIERDIMGCTHAEIGAYLAGLWRLPLPVVEAVAFHHTPQESDTESFGPLAAVYAANILVLQNSSDNDNNGTPLQFDADFLTESGLETKIDGWRELAKTTEQSQSAC